jgi:hypothetical protein
MWSESVLSWLRYCDTELLLFCWGQSQAMSRIAKQRVYGLLTEYLLGVASGNIAMCVQSRKYCIVVVIIIGIKNLLEIFNSFFKLLHLL